MGTFPQINYKILPTYNTFGNCLTNTIHCIPGKYELREQNVHFVGKTY